MAKKKDNVAKKEAKQQKQEVKANKKAKKVGKSTFGDDIDGILAEFAVNDRKNVTVQMDVVTEGFIPGRSGSAMVAHPTRPEILFFGGEMFDGKKVTTYNDAYIYNVPKNQLTKITIPQQQGPGPRTSAASAMVELNGSSSMFLCCGDFTSPKQQFKHYSDLFVLNFPENNNYAELKWEKITSAGAPSMRSGHRMVYYKRKLYVFGGFYDNNDSVKYLDDLYVFDLDTYTWSKHDGKKSSGNWPKARSGFGFVVVEGYAYIYGGYTTVTKNSDETGNVLSDMWQLNLATLEWTQIKSGGDVPKSLAGASMFAVKGRMFLFGGCTDVHNNDDTIDSVFYNTFYEFNLRKKVWEVLSVGVGKDPFNKPAVVTDTSSVPVEDKKKKKGSKGESSAVETKSWKWGSDEAIPIVPTKQEENTEEDDSLFLMLDNLEIEDEADEDKSSVAKRTGFVFPRRNAQICVKNGLVYIFGGVLEQGDKEVTLDDLHYIDTRKMKTAFTLRDANIAGQKWEEEEDEDDDDDMDDEDEEEEVVKGKKSGNKKKRQDDDDDDDEEEEDDMEDTETDPLQPKKGEDARKYFERTKEHYINAAMVEAGAELTDKELRTAAFALANKAYKDKQ